MAVIGSKNQLYHKKMFEHNDNFFCTDRFGTHASNSKPITRAVRINNHSPVGESQSVIVNITYHI